jgi:hypothetical protein
VIEGDLRGMRGRGSKRDGWMELGAMKGVDEGGYSGQVNKWVIKRAQRWAIYSCP